MFWMFLSFNSCQKDTIKFDIGNEPFLWILFFNITILAYITLGLYMCICYCIYSIYRLFGKVYSRVYSLYCAFKIMFLLLFIVIMKLPVLKHDLYRWILKTWYLLNCLDLQNSSNILYLYNISCMIAHFKLNVNCLGDQCSGV